MGDVPAWSAKRLALKWGCAPSTIYKMIDRGELRAFGIGRRGLRSARTRD